MSVHPLRSTSRARAVPPLYPEGIVADRFRIIETIGVGGSATVFEAEDLQTGELIALKAIPAQEKLRKRARREMQCAAALDHGAIVKMRGNAEDDDYIYVAFELVRGNDLSDVLKEKRLEESEILRAVAAVCDALEHAHSKSVIHRDVKPGNILLREDGILKLTDFGIAQIDHPDATVDESLLGTLSYMSPEQVRGDMTTGSTDVWSSALVAYEALTRRNHRPDLPSVATKMIDRALDPDNQRRPLPGQLRDALLRGAIAMERGQADMDPSIEVPRPDPRVNLRKRWLRAVPDRHEAASPRLPRSHARTGAGVEHSALEQQLTAVAERVQPYWPSALTGVGGTVLLGALPFYPTGWPVAIGILAAIVALRLPWLGAGLVLAAGLPLLGNLAFGLVPPAAILLGIWLVLMLRDGRRVLQPLVAPFVTVCVAWALYPLRCGTSPRVWVRGALGAAGALTMTIALGLSGFGSPLTPTADLAALSARIATSDDVIVTAGNVAAAIGFGPLLLACVWAALAVTAPAVLSAQGRALATAAGLWLGTGTLATLAIGVALSGTLVAPLETVMGAGAAGIVVLIRARRPEAASAAAANAD